MLTLLRPLLAPLISLVLWTMASGLFNTFIPVRLEMEGVHPEVIGIVTAALSLGILVGSLWMESLIIFAGHIRSFVFFAVFSMALALIQGLWVNPWYWAALRFIGGLCVAGIFIGIESWLLIQGGEKQRSLILSLYLAVYYLALTIGQFLFTLSNPANFSPFLITAVCCAISVIPLTIKKIEEPRIEKSVRLSLIQLFYLSPFGLAGSIISGALLATIYGLVPVYATEIGLSTTQVGYLMAMIIFGGLSLQWPMGLLADRGNRRLVLHVAGIGSALFAIAISSLAHPPFWALLVLGWGFGGFSFTLYPLSMAYASENLQNDQIIAATGSFVLSYGIGAIIGPLAAPMMMNAFGVCGLFYFLGGTSLLLSVFGFLEKGILSQAFRK